MNSRKYLHIKAPKSSQNTKKPAKKGRPPIKNLTVSSVEQSLNLTDISIEPQNQTFTFHPNQDSDNDESEIEFIATEKSYIEEELTEDTELQIFKALKKKQSEKKTIKNHKNVLEKSISANEKGDESIELPQQFKNTRNFNKSVDFEIKSKLNTSLERLSSSTPKKSNSKPSNVPPAKKTMKPDVSEQEEEIFVPQNRQTVEPEFNPEKKAHNSEANSKPAKKVKMDKQNKSRPEVKFSVDIKLLNSKEKVAKVVKFGNEGKTKKSSEAVYIVELEEETEYKAMNDVEMTHFYKDPLIDFYQGLHFN